MTTDADFTCPICGDRKPVPSMVDDCVRRHLEASRGI